jgi:hypothetical protein
LPPAGFVVAPTLPMEPGARKKGRKKIARKMLSLKKAQN